MKPEEYKAGTTIRDVLTTGDPDFLNRTVRDSEEIAGILREKAFELEGWRKCDCNGKLPCYACAGTGKVRLRQSN